MGDPPADKPASLTDSPQRPAAPPPDEGPAAAGKVVAAEENGPAAGVPEEVEVWWGSYSGWTMMPSCVVCMLLTAVLAWTAWYLIPPRLVRLAIFGMAGAVW